MLQFVQSAWLWATSGIILPVVIHLWNVKQGKTLKIGSIVFLSESANSHAKSLKLSELLLLLLRCLLIVVLAMLIAKPFYQKQLDLQKEKGWVLIEKKQVHQAYGKFKPIIDSLIHAGFTFHYFNTDFKEAKFEDVVKVEGDTANESEMPYWTLLKELNEKVPSKLPVYLFTDNLLKRFSNSRPNVSLNLHWQVYPSSDTLSNWLKKAYQTSGDSIRVVLAHSSTIGTRYSYHNVSLTDGNSKFILQKTDGKTFVRYQATSKIDSNNPVIVDTSATVISIYHKGFGLDANYVRAATEAIKDFTKHRMKVSVVTDVQHIPANYKWLFWLSEEKIPALLVKNNVFLYEKGGVENRPSQLITDDKAALSTPDNIPLYKLISANVNGAVTLWKTGYGNPVLTVQKAGATIYHFYSRFNPQWTGLPWSARFPQVMFNLLLNQSESSGEINEADKRVIEVAQILPVISPQETADPKQNLVDKADLSKLFWIIAFMLFVLERLVSSRVKKEEAYG